jgi:hypothetical protein
MFRCAVECASRWSVGVPVVGILTQECEYASRGYVMRLRTRTAHGISCDSDRRNVVCTSRSRKVTENTCGIVVVGVLGIRYLENAGQWRIMLKPNFKLAEDRVQCLVSVPVS